MPSSVPFSSRSVCASFICASPAALVVASLLFASCAFAAASAFACASATSAFASLNCFCSSGVSFSVRTGTGICCAGVPGVSWPEEESVPVRSINDNSTVHINSISPLFRSYRVPPQNRRARRGRRARADAPGLLANLCVVLVLGNRSRNIVLPARQRSFVGTCQVAAVGAAHRMLLAVHASLPALQIACLAAGQL